MSAHAALANEPPGLAVDEAVLEFEAGAARLQNLLDRARRREVTVAIYTSAMFLTGNDVDNRAVVRRVATAQLDLVGLALRAPQRDADAILRGLAGHP